MDEYEVEQIALRLDEIEEAITQYANEFGDVSNGVLARFLVIAEIVPPEGPSVMLEITSEDLPLWMRDGMLYAMLHSPPDLQEDDDE